MLSMETYSLRICTDPDEAVGMLRKREYDLVITTLVMQKMGGFDLVRRIRGEGYSVPIMLITAYGSRESAIEAQRLGVSDYLYQPVAGDELRARVARVFARVREGQEGRSAFQLDKLVSRDPVMKGIFDMVEGIANGDSRVLILGETGTGKQLIAQAIHSLSPRRDKPFVEINCAAVPEKLLESEFFGHERGAFTGAVARRVGRFEEAQEGTIFLDEIGEVDYALQAKLLRVLDSGRLNRVGGGRTLRSNARVIAATNRDLRKASQQGQFRADLFYRLHVISVTIPPLRKRKEDLPFLTRYFLERYLAPGRRLEFSREAMRVMEAYSWPGNVRELEHLVERFSVMHSSPVVRVEDLPAYMAEDSASASDGFSEDLGFREARREFERRYLESALRRNDGNMARAARSAKMDRAQFFRLVRRHDLDPAALRRPVSG